MGVLAMRRGWTYEAGRRFLESTYEPASLTSFKCPQKVDYCRSSLLLSTASCGHLRGMKTDLLQLLNRTSITHPTRIVAVEASHLQLRVRVSSNQWWRNSPSAEEGQIVFTFEGIGEGQFHLETLLDMDDYEALEIFEVSLLSDKDWAKVGPSFATYCSEPLPHPLQLYSIIEDYLWAAGALHSARDYLNIPGGSLLRFCEISATSSYLLAEAPSKIHELILAELKRQNVSHNVICSEQDSNQTLFVQIGDSSFVCERATAEV
jgi:hypothetical protein